MHSEASDRQVLENDLRQAIDRGELWVAYQPIVRAAGEEISRLRGAGPLEPSRSAAAISPDKFIPLAEECGLIGKIGKWVLDTALEEAANWPDQVRIAVNLSPIQFNDPTSSTRSSAALDRYRRPRRAGSSWRSPKACSWPTATRPTTPSPG